MRIEKHYYSEEVKVWQEAELAAEQRERADTEGERVREELRSEKKAEEISRIAGDRQKSSYQLVHTQRMDRFGVLIQKALELAEAAPMDIVAETEKLFGRIQMRAGSFMIMESSQKSMREDLAALIEESATISISKGKDGLIEFTFIYPFSSEIEKS